MMDLFNFSFIQQGGVVMWPLLALSLIGFVFFVERTLYLHKGQIRTDDFVSGIKNLLRKRRLMEALTVCEETPGPVGNIMKAALLNYDKEDSQVRSAVQSAALVQIPALERRVGSIGVIAKAAPLLGLLGTVFGLLDAFTSLESAGAYAHVTVLSGGVREALSTTAFGLTIAIVAMLAHHFLTGRVRALVHDMEWVANDILQFLDHELIVESEGN